MAPARRSASARTARSIRATSAPARSRTGRTSRRASASRWTCSATAAPRSRRARRATSPARQIAFANQVNPIGALTATDTRAWTDLDGNGLPLDANGNIQFNELHQLGVDADLRPPDGADDAVLARPAARLGQARLQQRVHVRDAAPARRSHLGERRLLSPHVRQPDVHRRPALRREQLRLVLHHGADAIPTCRTAAATRCAACRTSSRRCSRRTCRPTA